jgi:uncharacterized protein (TIGR02452 family)
MRISKNKESRKEKAYNWLIELDTHWSKEVADAVSNTTLNKINSVEKLNSIIKYNPKVKYNETRTDIFNEDVVSCAIEAASRNKNSKVCVLNFASYYSPGGGFLNGSRAQEESICNESGLYPCLDKFRKEYEERRLNRIDGLYRHDYIYSSNVPFIKDGKCYLVDVLTIAAPNKTATKSLSVEQVFEERMHLAYKIPAMHNVDILLLGAWGCGVFGNDPEFVASNWKKLTEEYNGVYGMVIHPVLDRKMYSTFTKVYK